MSFLDKTGLQTLTKKLVQGDAIKVASHRGHTVKNVIDNIQRECDNVANPLEYKMENRVADFKIGKGRDVDVSGDVENGYTEVELQGKTYQNLINDNKWLHSETKITSSHTNNVSLVATSFLRNKNLMKPSTTYTLILDLNIALNTLKNSYFQLNCERVDGKQESVVRITNVSYLRSGGLMRVKFTTSDTFFRLAQAFIGGYGGTLTIKSNGMTILEGDHTQTPAEELPQYFEGIKSSFEDGIVDVEVVGKNNFKVEMPTLHNGWGEHNVTLGESGFTFEAKNGWNKVGFEYPHLANKVVTVSANVVYKIKKNQQQINGEQIIFISNTIDYGIGEKFSIVGENNSVNIVATLKLKNDGVVAFQGSCNLEGVGNIVEWTLNDVQIEEYSIKTHYEPYYKKKISFNIGEPLRSLPSGVCDEIRNNNGQWELVRRVCKMVLDGTQPVGSMDEYCGIKTSTTLFRIGQNMYGIKKGGTPISDRFSYDRSAWVNDFPSICCVEKSLDIRILKTSLEGFDDSLDSTQKSIIFKNYLSQNPTTTYFELENPTITPIVPIEFDVKPLASMSINSEISPTSNHSVVLNRAGQIERAICDIAELKNRVEALETIYDTTFLETQHKLSLLEMDYELEGGSV